MPNIEKAQCYIYWNRAQFNVLMPDCGAPPVCFILALVKKWLQRRAGGRRTPLQQCEQDDVLQEGGAAGNNLGYSILAALVAPRTQVHHHEGSTKFYEKARSRIVRSPCPGGAYAVLTVVAKRTTVQ